MLNHILSVSLIIATIYMIYLINNSFQDNTINVKDKNYLEVNILADCVVILSRDGCPYCLMLDEMLKEYNTSKYTIVKVSQTGGFIFDDTFTNLEISKRENIIQEVTNVIKSGIVYFPTLLVKNKIHTGLPTKEKLNEIFN
jgi:glutaredoxin